MSRAPAFVSARPALVARVRTSVAVGSDPILNLTGVVPATRRALARAGMTLADPERVNVRGGAIANGHPLGASGAKLTATLAHAMAARGAAVGLQAMCEGGGMANAAILERT